ncbi:MAG: SGNH/GDSL hydrolase family protein [Spirochaetes bacterium]|nr:SGNH/GDSL hydrolase family protein [Spirochaetota bacterium]
MFPLKAGETLVAIGDSITQDGRYLDGLRTFHATRWPRLRVRFVNAGVGGNTAQDVLGRFPIDVAPLKPAVALLMLGMNDAGGEYDPRDSAETRDAFRAAKVAAYRARLAQLAGMLDGLGTRLIWASPTPYDEEVALPVPARRGWNRTLAEMAKAMGDFAAKRGETFIDLHAAMDGLQNGQRERDPAFTLCGNDRVHPQGLGHAVMARLLLAGLDVPPRVASIEIDAGAPGSSRWEGGRLSSLKRTPRGLRFRWRSDALPWIGDGEATQAARALTHPLPEWNGAPLAVTGLAPGSHRLVSDGETIYRADAETWARGVDLARIPAAPDAARSERVRDLSRRRTELEGLLGVVRYARESLRRAGIDPADADLACGHLVKTHAWLAPNVIRVFAHRGRQRELRDEIGFLERALYREARPAWQAMELVQEG